MRLAIPHWQGRVSPVFDVAGSLLLIDIDCNGEIKRRSIALKDENPLGRAKSVADLSVDILICGAISRLLELALVFAGIKVFPQICGDVEEVLAAFVVGQLRQKKFLMPDCYGRRRRFRRGRRG